MTKQQRIRGVCKIMAGKKRYRSSNRREMICISAIVLVLLGVMFVQSNGLKEKNAASVLKIESLNAQIEEESERALEIEELEEYVKTPEYAGEKARENLGMVGEDEILFKAQD